MERPNSTVGSSNSSAILLHWKEGSSFQYSPGLSGSMERALRTIS